jgi:hypothetical protein
MGVHLLPSLLHPWIVLSECDRRDIEHIRLATATLAAGLIKCDHSRSSAPYRSSFATFTNWQWPLHLCK